MPRRRSPRFLYARLATLVVVIIAVLAFHAHGSTLVVLRIAAIALVGVLVVAAGWFAGRRRGGV
jgi:hypothetical protein